MCGIIGYIGQKNAVPILLDALEAMEYRGYDSAGIVTQETGVIRVAGRVASLREKVSEKSFSKSGIGHTRWATHGAPTEKNAHPHISPDGKTAVVHNGIIENFRELKDEFSTYGLTCTSETDTEMVALCIQYYREQGMSLEEAFLKTIPRLSGTYGLVVIDPTDSAVLYGARLGSPLIIGIGEKEEYFIASDASALAPYTKEIVYLEDHDIVKLSRNGYHFLNENLSGMVRPVDRIEWGLEMIQRGGYKHFMLKEIMQAKEVIENSMRGRLDFKNMTAKLGGLEHVRERLTKTDRIVIVGCGTSYYAGLVGEYILEDLARIPVEVELASEFRYRNPLINERTTVIALSQSGETADTLEALREAERRGALTLGIVNVVGSSISRMTQAGVYNHIGPEVGVASTKAFISTLVILNLMGLMLGRERKTISYEKGRQLVDALTRLPEQAQSILDSASDIQKVAKAYKRSRDFLYIGRNMMYPIALEGALKLKEITYVHAEGCSAGEMKHGILAMIDESFPTIAIAPKNMLYEKMISNIEEIRARRGPVLGVVTQGDSKLISRLDHSLIIPDTELSLTPVLATIPLQLFAYYSGVQKNLDIDKPRNLAKSVTVE